jgi:hypothetical protein
MEDRTHRANVIDDIFTEQWRDPARRYEAMLEWDGETMGWNVENTNPVNNTSISREALELLTGHFRTWLGSRIFRRMAEGKNAKKVRAVLTVTFED